MYEKRKIRKENRESVSKVYESCHLTRDILFPRNGILKELTNDSRTSSRERV